MNTLKSALWLTLLTTLLLFMGAAIGGRHGIILALAMAAIINFVRYFHSDKFALAPPAARRIQRLIGRPSIY